MTSDAALIIQTFLSASWSLFNCPIPGTFFTAKDMVLFMFFSGVLIRVLHLFFGFGSHGRPDSGGKRKVSSDRKDDEK